MKERERENGSREETKQETGMTFLWCYAKRLDNLRVSFYINM